MALRSALGAGRGAADPPAPDRERRRSRCSAAGSASVVAAAGRELLVLFAARFTPRASEIAIDGPVLLFTLGVSLVTGIALGLIPALSSRRSLVVGAAESGGDRASASAARQRGCATC